MNNENAEKLEYYLRLPYTIEVIRGDAESGGWAARVVELPGCITAAETFEALGPMLEDAMRLWIATALEDRRPVPEPRDAQDYSGKFIVRVPRWLHRQITERAEQESISLNQYVSTALASAVSQPGGPQDAQSIKKDEIKAWIHEAVQQSVQALVEPRKGHQASPHAAGRGLAQVVRDNQDPYETRPPAAPDSAGKEP